MILILHKALVKDGSMNSVDFSKGIVVDVLEYGIEEKHEVFDNSNPTIKIVKGGDGEVVSDSWLHLKQEVLCLGE